MSTSHILVSGENFVSTNVYKVDLPNTTDLNDYEVALGQGYVYYSWANINQFPLNNSQFVLKVPGMADQTITIPTGTYEISDLNNYLEYWFIQNGLYIYNTSTLINTYYASFTVSPTSYQIQWTTTTIPAALPAGYTTGGANMTAAFANSNNLKQMQLVISATNNFGNILGMSAGTYPTLATGNPSPYTYQSDFTPNVNPISGVQIRLSCVNNAFSANTQLLYIFSNGQNSVGQQIDISPNETQFVPCMGSHKELTLTFFDQIGNPLHILDTNIILKLVFRRAQ
jgi:hypothetical protein